MAFPVALKVLVDQGLVAAEPGARVMQLREHFLALFGVARLVISALTGLVIVYAVLSWVRADSPVADIIDRLRTYARDPDAAPALEALVLAAKLRHALGQHVVHVGDHALGSLFLLGRLFRSLKQSLLTRLPKLWG